MQQPKSQAYKLAYRVGHEVGFALFALAALVNFIMFPFPRQ